jgi:hypothetical protein
MEWLAGTVVGFVVILTVVVVLARGSTERWEKEKRVALRPRVRLAQKRASRRSRPAAKVRPARISRRVRRRADRASAPVSDSEDPQGLR